MRPYIRVNLRSIMWSFFPFFWYDVVFPHALVKLGVWEDEGPTRNLAKGKPWSSNRSISQSWLQSWVRSQNNHDAEINRSHVSCVLEKIHKQ